MRENELWETRFCLGCGIGFLIRKKCDKKFCSLSCSSKYHIGKNNSNYNNRWNKKQRKVASNRMKERLQNGFHPAGKFTNTKPHLRLAEILASLGFRVLKEVNFGTFFIDCYTSEFHLGFEADGPYHSKGKDKKRDKFLLESFKLPILRLKNDVLMAKGEEENVKNTIMSFISSFSDKDEKERLNFAKTLVIRNFDVSESYVDYRKGKTKRTDNSGNKYWDEKKKNNFKCPKCGIVEERLEGDNRKYCSGRCAQKSRWKTKEIICVGCGQTFKISSFSKRKYCSTKCYHKNFISWNTGQTKDTSKKLKAVGEKISESKKGKTKGKYQEYMKPEIYKKQIERIKRTKCSKCGKFFKGKCSCI